MAYILTCFIAVVFIELSLRKKLHVVERMLLKQQESRKKAQNEKVLPFRTYHTIAHLKRKREGTHTPKTWRPK